MSIKTKNNGGILFENKVTINDSLEFQNDLEGIIDFVGGVGSIVIDNTIDYPFSFAIQDQDLNNYFSIHGSTGSTSGYSKFHKSLVVGATGVTATDNISIFSKRLEIQNGTINLSSESKITIDSSGTNKVFLDDSNSNFEFSLDSTTFKIDDAYTRSNPIISGAFEIIEESSTNTRRIILNSGSINAAASTTATGEGSVAIGSRSSASGYYSIAIGGNTGGSTIRTVAGATFSVALGYNSEATAQGAVAIGGNNEASGTSSFALGRIATARATNSVAIGSVYIETGSTATNSVAIGTGTGSSNRAINKEPSTIKLFSSSSTESMTIRSTSVDVEKDFNVGSTMLNINISSEEISVYDGENIRKKSFQELGFTGGTGTTALWNLNTSSNVFITLSENKALEISNIQSGDTGVLKVIQDGTTGGWDLTLPSNSKVIDGGVGSIDLTNVAGGIDLLSFIYDGTDYLWTYGLNFS